MITYLLAIASPTHGVPAEMYYSGWAGQSERATEYRAGWSGSTDGDHYANGHAYYGINVDVGFGTGAPLFFNNTPILDSIRTAWQGKVAVAASGGPPVTYPSLVDDYLIEAHRDHPGTGCPVSAVGALSKMERKPIMRLA
jgi:Putative glucoamylase